MRSLMQTMKPMWPAFLAAGIIASVLLVGGTFSVAQTSSDQPPAQQRSVSRQDTLKGPTQADPAPKKTPRKKTAQQQTARKKSTQAATGSKAYPDLKSADTLTQAHADSSAMKAALDADTSAASVALPPPFEYRKIRNDAFTVGERLQFTVNYGFITAGEATMSVPDYEVVNGRQCYRVEFAVNSLENFDWVYRVQDRYLTYIDVEAMAPLKFEQHIREGTYRRDFIAEFDQARHIAKTTEGEYPIPEYVHDIMSAFYYVRTLDFSGFMPGEHTVLHNFYKDKSYELLVRFLGRQELEVEAGTFNTVVVEPLVREGGLFKSEGRIVIWLSDDDRKIPVRVNTKVVIGSIDVELQSYSGLNGPLRSRTD
jgi:hypothetical protein